MDRDYILKLLHAQINVNGHIIGAATGSGMTAKYAAMGGADILLALSSGKYRIMGRSSYAGYLCYGNSNEQSMELGKRELLPLIDKVPVLIGLFASDPFIQLYDFLKEIKAAGFSGVINYPTLSLIDGDFRQALREEGNTYEKEVEAIKLAHYLDLFTVGFVTNIDEADMMLEAGADVICVNFGLTKGGMLGSRQYISLEEARKESDEIFSLCEKKNPDVIRMIYGGPATTPIDMQYMYHNTLCQGYIGGSVFERIPAERSILNTTKAFKSFGNFDQNDPLYKLLEGRGTVKDSVEFVKKYIEEHYMEDVQLGDLALVTHVSPSWLSVCFKRETGCSFTEYLVRFRVNKAGKLLQENCLSCKEVASEVGYEDYAQFSKIFKKYTGYSPKDYMKQQGKELL